MSQLIFCPECNNQILIIPDVKAMSIAIEAHVKTHNIKSVTPVIKDSKDFIREDMIKQLFEKILLIPTEKKETVLTGVLDKYPYEGFYVNKDQYVNDTLKPFLGKNIKITIEEI